MAAPDENVVAVEQLEEPGNAPHMPLKALLLGGSVADTGRHLRPAILHRSS